MATSRQQTYEHFNHRRLWAAARAQWEVIPLVPTYKAKHYQLSAILLMSFVLEGYFNWLLSICVPKVYSQEQKFFNKDPYRGTSGKCRYLLELLQITDWLANERPVNTVREVERLRHCLVHPKPESGTREVAYEFPDMPQVHSGQIARRMNSALMERTREDFDRLAKRMQNEACEKFGVNLGAAEPFCGLIGYHSTEM